MASTVRGSSVSSDAPFRMDFSRGASWSCFVSVGGLGGPVRRESSGRFVVELSFQGRN